MSDGLDVTFAIGKVKYLCCLHSDSVADGSHGRQTWHRVSLLLVLPSIPVRHSGGPLGLTLTLTPGMGGRYVCRLTLCFRVTV